jgi:alpha-glucosidase
MYSSDRPEIHDVIAEWRRLSDQYQDRVLIGELYLPIEKLVMYYGVDGSGVQLPFNFHLILQPWKARAIDDLIETYERALPRNGWPNWVLGNHDKHRLASRVSLPQARVAAMLLLTLRGTPTLYYGDELGMQDVAIPSEQVQDPWEKRVPGLGLGRDPERTPMQWDDGPQAGFTEGTPWLPIASDYAQRNVAVEQKDPRSFLSLYQKLLALRRNTPALEVGSYRRAEVSGDLLAYVREHAGQRLLVALNLGPHQVTLQTAELAGGQVTMSTYLDREEVVRGQSLTLRGDEGLIVGIR